MLQESTQNMQYLLFLYSKNSYVNAPEYYVILTLPVG